MYLRSKVKHVKNIYKIAHFNRIMLYRFNIFKFSNIFSYFFGMSHYTLYKPFKLFKDIL